MPLSLGGTWLFGALLAATAPRPAAGPSDPAAPLAKDEARIFADAPGGVVQAALERPANGKAKLETIQLRDGDVVTIVGDDAGIGAGGEIASAEVLVRGKHFRVPNERVITEDRLQRRGPWAVFSLFE